VFTLEPTAEGTLVWDTHVQSCRCFGKDIFQMEKPLLWRVVTFTLFNEIR